MKSVIEFIIKYSELPQDFFGDRDKHLSELDTLKRLYEGDHLSVFQHELKDIYKEHYVIDNILRDGTKIKLDIMRKAKIIVHSLKRKDKIMKWNKKNKLRKQLASAFEHSMVFKNSYFYLQLAPNLKNPNEFEFKLRQAHPTNVFCIKSEEYVNDIDYVYCVNESDDKEQIEMILHSPIDCVKLLYVKDNGKYVLTNQDMYMTLINKYITYQDNDFSDESFFYDQDTGYLNHQKGDFFFWNVQNESTNNFISVSDYTKNIITKVSRLNKLATVEEKTILDFANPHHFLDRGTIQLLAREAEFMIDGIKELSLEGKKFLPTSGENFKLEKLTVDSFITELMERKEKLKDEILNAMGIDSGLFREKQASGNIQSGKALEMENYKTLSNVEAKLSNYVEFLQDLYRTMEFLELKNGKNIEVDEEALEDVEVEFEITLFKDKEEEIKLEQLKVELEQKKADLGLIKSKRTMTKEIEGSTDEELDVEAQLVQDEQDADLPIRNEFGEGFTTEDTGEEPEGVTEAPYEQSQELVGNQGLLDKIIQAIKNVFKGSSN